MARLPIPGADDGSWGQILNDYLGQAHDATGALKNSLITTANLKAGSGADGQVLILDSSMPGGFRWTTSSLGPATPSALGTIQLAGDLGGTATAPTVPGLAAKYTKPGSGIPASDLAGGITASLLDPNVNASLTKANSSVQSVNGKLPDIAGAVTLTAADVGATPGATQLVDLTDVDASAPADNQVLAYDLGSNKWVPNTVTSTTVSDATTSVKGIVQLAGDLAGVASAPTVPGLAAKADVATTYTKTEVDGALVAKANVSDLADYLPTSQKAAANGVASLDALGKVPTAQLPTVPGQVNSDWGAVSGVEEILNKPALATVATSGSYVDLTNKPTIPTTLDSLTDVAAAGATNNQVLTYDTTAGEWQPKAGVSDATPSAKGVVQLAGDLGGTAAAPAVEKVKGVTLPASAPTNGQVLTATGAATTAWSTPSAAGESNTASNLGTGVGVYKQKTGVNLELKTLAAASTKISIVNNGPSNTVDFDVNTANLGLTKSDVGLANVDNTADANKPVSTATQTALNAKADKTTTITGTNSIAGGGDLSANRTLSLVNDSATPGNSRYYGTDGAGAKGYYTLPVAPSAILNQSASAQSANYWIQSAAPASVAATVQGATSQTANILEVKDASGNTPVSINSSGDVTIARRSLTMNITTTNAQRFQLSGNTQSSATNQYGAQIEPIFLPTGTVSNIYSLSNTSTLASSVSNVSQIFGIVTGTHTLASYTGTLSNATALNIQAPLMNGSKTPTYFGISVVGVATNGGNTTGTIDNILVNITSSTAAASTGGTVHNVGLRVIQPAGAGLGTTYNTAVAIGDTNIAPNGNWSLYNEASQPSHFSSNVHIGTTANPNNYALQVAGTVNATNVFENNVELGWVSAPATATSSGVVGQKAFDSGFFYTCTATNTWKRVAISSW